MLQSRQDSLIHNYFNHLPDTLGSNPIRQGLHNGQWFPLPIYLSPTDSTKLILNGTYEKVTGVNEVYIINISKRNK